MCVLNRKNEWLRKAAKEYKIKEVAVAGGVSANNGLRNAFREHAEKYGWDISVSYTHLKVHDKPFAHDESG